MSVHGDQYVPDSGQSGHERLRTIGEIHDDRTRTLLLGAGLAARDRYVEFGCGLGTRRDSRSFVHAADDDPLALVAHARMHQLVARKPKP
jgi:hypothetical protein